ncbi:MAG: outer membrane protein assembly factor BamA [Elusimicrobiota bacterium]
MEKITKISVIALITLIICLDPAMAAGKNGEKIIRTAFRGNKKFSDSSISRLVITRKSGLIKKRFFYENNTEEDLKRIRSFYLKNGYLDIKASYDLDISKRKGKELASITFLINEGEIYNTGDLKVTGNEYYTEQELKDNYRIEKGKPFSKQKLDNSVASLLAFYANNGFIDTDIQTDLKVDSEARKVDISVMITENARYRIGATVISGISKTRPYIVERELLYSKGDIINASKLLDTRKNLFLTGLFNNIQVRPVTPSTGHDDTKDIQVDLNENMSVEFGLSVGYDTIEKFWQQAELYNYNFRGKAQKYGIMVRRSELRDHAELSFSEPRMWGSMWRGDLNLFTRAGYEPGYTLYNNGGKLSAGRDFRKMLKLVLSYKIESSRYTDLKIYYEPSQQIQWRHEFAVTTTYDTRDDIFNTSDGILLEQSNEYSITDKDLLRMIFRGRRFIHLSEKLIFATAAEFSIIISKADIDAINPAQRFYTGGPNSIRGFGYNKVGPLNESGAPLGGKVKFVWNIAELRMRLTKIAAVNFFADAGNIWRSIDRTDLSALRFSPGLGTMAVTPIGVLRIEYAFNVAPEPGEDKGLLFFGAGLAF